ncbi:hypothetical protein O0L34_g14921 [Tuta absoluta]|nr:hypothetical protein O0L34_g14921 [Tuta absoluta]
MPDFKSNPVWRKALKILPFGIFIGIGTLIVGICILSIQYTIETHEKKCNGTTTNYTYEYINSLDYSNCTNTDFKPCRDSLTSFSCSCNIVLEVPNFVEGDVVLSYSLDTFFDGNKTKLLSSRDNLQLSGILNTTVSSACSSPYDYDNGKPIAPCGALADAMFTDYVYDIYDDNNEVLPKMAYGLLHDNDKIGFKNPPGDLKTAFQNFSRPRSWKKSIWELDEKNTNNNGFENEAFIMWMRYNELSVRPMWRLNQTAEKTYEKGLPPYNYTVTVYYKYPYSLYPGPRNLTLYREIPIEEPICEVITTTVLAPVSYGVGVTATVIGVILLVASAALVLAYHKVKATNDDNKHQSVNHTSAQNSTINSTPAPTTTQDAIEEESAIKTNIANEQTNNIAKENGDSEEKLLSAPPCTAKHTEPEQKPLNDIQEEEEYL